MSKGRFSPTTFDRLPEESYEDYLERLEDQNDLTDIWNK